MNYPITIIIPCLNTAPHLLEETLRSIRGSTFQNYSVVIVNDGSTDPETLAALSRAESSDARLRVIHHPENRGLSAARNTGVAACQTPYFLQLDADDLIEPTFIEKCLWALEAHPEWSFCNAWVKAFGAREYLWQRGFERRTDFLAENQVTSIAVIRREADRAIGGHDESIRDGLEDWDYWLRMAAYGYWGGTIPEFLIRYRQHDIPTQWPNRDNIRKRMEFRQYLRRRYPKLWKRNGFPRPTHPAKRPVLSVIPFSNPVPKQAGKPRVLLILPWLNLGGADKFNLNLVGQLSRRGYSISICTTVPSANSWLAEFSRYTPDIFSLPNFLTPEAQPLFLRYMIESRQTDVVLISNSMLGYSLLPYLRAHCPQTIFVDYNHMVVSQWLEGGFPGVAVHDQPHLDLNIVNSEQVRQWMIARGADPARIEVCHINQDTDQWDPARFDRQALRKKMNLPENETILLYPARLDPQKRPRILIEILRQLRDHGQRFVCLVAGDGPQRNWLEAAVRRYRLGDAVRLLGPVPPTRMPELMAVSDILLLPSKEEGIALSLFEAMAMQVVPVSADVGGQRELVTPETGFLIPHGPDEVTQYVAVLTRLMQSPELRLQIGRAARDRIVAHFTLDQMAARMIALFEKARHLAQTEPRPRLSLEDAQVLVEGVVDDLRYERLQERLRAEKPLAVSGPEHGLISHWRAVVYQLKKHFFRPAYYWALRNGQDWVVPLTNWAYNRLRWLLK